ncbi:MAG: acyl-CoA reductase [Salibacteraceae bacterium]|jgi:hypothetical protein|nr:acyl-CoA reductase [Salibacteraceae bacterium]MDP4687626.1 acyl-CoA reductase [Salibacteraceae bacterium]MDP4764279.1 acyl-CoA reductase [Salibacteraceae bacterium]MDP4965573.1 acyl-CoA reductase [Salibacteraceae bacterium]
MISLSDRIEAFHALGTRLSAFVEDPNSEQNSTIKADVTLAFHKNGWFDEREVLHAIAYWADALQKPNLLDWLSNYDAAVKSTKKVAVVAAGNIPLVGFHDVMCVLLSGHKAMIKCSSSDEILLPLFLNLLKEAEPRFEDLIELIPFKLEGFDAVIATGSNNSARHFQQYFGKYPSIIRKNRTGIAILDGTESAAELKGLIEDAYRYYGLGCRNITKLYLPKDFDLNKIFEASVPFAYLMENKKFANNYTYHKTLMMMENRPILENELLLLVENASLYSPVSVLNYEYYADIAQLNEKIEAELDHIQCVVSKTNTPFGMAQKPTINQYADGVDTMMFLTNLA